MPLLTIIFVIIIVGVALWLINSFIPMASIIKTILNIVVVVILIVWLLKAFGLYNDLINMHF